MLGVERFGSFATIFFEMVCLEMHRWRAIAHAVRSIAQPKLAGHADQIRQ